MDALKVCTRCKQAKDVDMFALRRRKSGSTGRQPWCKPCQKEYKDEHYRSNSPKYIQKNRERRQELTIWLRGLKERPCADCGERYPYYVMDFDHREPGKKHFNVAQLVRTFGFSRQRIREEVEKCDVVCANCHRERTYGPFVYGLG